MPFVKAVFDVTVIGKEIRVDTESNTVDLLPVEEAVIRINGVRQYPETGTNGSSTFRLVEYHEPGAYHISISKKGYERVAPITKHLSPGLDTLTFSLFTVANLRSIENVIKKEIKGGERLKAQRTIDLVKEAYPDFYDLAYFGNLHRFEEALQKNVAPSKMIRRSPESERKTIARKDRDEEREDRYAFLAPDDRKKVEAINRYLDKEELNAAQDMLNILKRSSETIDYFTVELLQGKIEAIKDRLKMEAWGGLQSSPSAVQNN